MIGGTLLTGGVGYVDGTLSSWWTRIVIGALLFVFCLLQRVFESGRGRAA